MYFFKFLSTFLYKVFELYVMIKSLILKFLLKVKNVLSSISDYRIEKFQEAFVFLIQVEKLWHKIKL